MTSSRLASWKERARRLKTDIYALYLAYRDPRVPWYARLFIICVVAYAFSPLDLIPDFVPILGYLDDLLLLPLGIALAIRLIPPDVLAECRARAISQRKKPTNWVAAAVIMLIWVGCGTLIGWLVVG
jgi:uncharacterized membrane protein YkvA (DUF1232 family)